MNGSLFSAVARSARTCTECLHFRHVRSAALGFAALLLFASTATAQASFAEGFDQIGSSTATGPSALVSDGWIFRTQTVPATGVSWYYSDTFQPQAGTASLQVNSNAALTGSPPPIASHWLILPELPGVAAGDEVRFWTRNPWTTIFPTSRIQVRLSTSYGTDTGSGPTAVGDFDTLVAEYPAVAGSPWTERVSTLPAGGRIALRYLLDPAGVGTSGSFSIDSLTVGTPPAGPVPLPLPGGTVTWSNDIVIDSGLTTLPAGGTVVVDPGVSVRIETGSELRVEGTLIAQGTASSPIVITGDGPSARLTVRGTLDAEQVSLSAVVHTERGGRTFVRSSQITNPGQLESSSPLVPDFGVRPAFISLEDCTIDQSGLLLSDAELLVADSTFAQGGMNLTRTLFHFSGVTLTDSPGYGMILSGEGAPAYLDDTSITNAVDAGLYVRSGNVALGPNVVVQGNGVTAELFEGGFLPGAPLPTTGNLVDEVRVSGSGDRFFPAVWSDVGLPYRVEALYIARSGTLDVGPGVQVRLEPGAAIASDPSPFVARGSATAPIEFLPVDPANRWLSLTLPDRLEFCEVSGAEVGASFPPAFGSGFVDACRFDDNGTAIFGAARVTNTTLTGNDVAIDGPDVGGSDGPNRFEGNGSGVVDSADATANWWGDASGPMSPANPLGQGDSAAAGVPVLPFLTAAPDPTNAPPQVFVQRAAPILVPGQRILLNWTVENDGAITSQRILFSPWGSAYQVVAADLPADQRSFEWTVPSVGVALFTEPSRLRIEVTDDAGQRAWDETEHSVPSGTLDVDLDFTTTLPAEVPSNARISELCWTTASGLLADGYVFFEDTFDIEPLGGTTTSCLSAALSTPAVSSDLARVLVSVRDGGTNRFEAFLTEPFAVRPALELGDSPPQVELVAPPPGTRVVAGADLDIEWTASDDQGLRNIAIQASYDDGESWHFIAETVDPILDQYTWSLAPGAEFAQVRLRVIATDLRFQRSSFTQPASFSIGMSGGGSSFRRGDANGNGDVDIADAVFVLASLFVPGASPTDCADAADANDDGALDVSDAVRLLSALFTGTSGPLPAPYPGCGTDPTVDGLDCGSAPCP